MAIDSAFPLLEALILPDVDDVATLSPFTVTGTRGFLPLTDPLVDLPLPDFAALSSLLARMPLCAADGSPGLLASGSFGDAVQRELLDLSETVKKYAADMRVMTALYRDYSFVASAYLLEPCHTRFMEGKEYGLARSVLPKNIAMPLNTVSKIAGFKPWMEYAGSYALYNYRLEDPKLGMEYSNLRLVRAFEHGLNPQSSEAGFVLVHVDMVSHSGQLVTGALHALRGCKERNRAALEDGLFQVIEAMKRVNATMHCMWNKSKPGQYTSFRTFIFGIANQSMFPNGVVYEGVASEPQFFRGESGANDSMIPLCDNLLQVEMPDTPLTAILRNFRSYRPGNHREFLEWVHDNAELHQLKAYAMEAPKSAMLYLQALDQVRDFRWRHWSFTREYILKQSKHATATGGSPKITWLPNQLQAVLTQMSDVGKHCANQRTAQDILDLAELQLRTLRKEVEKYCGERE